MLVARRIIIALEIIVALLALGGGVTLIAQPTGEILGFDLTMLHGVFKNFLVPGLALIAMGLLHAVAAWTTWQRMLIDHVLSTLASGALIVWIAVQIIIVGFTNWTQPVFFLLGFVVHYLATELWREGEGPHLGMVDGYESLDMSRRKEVAPAWRTSDRWRFLQLILRRGQQAR